MLRIPLIVHGVPGAPAGVSIDTPVGLGDLAGSDGPAALDPRSAEALRELGDVD